jgi:hypothetical protein
MAARGQTEFNCWSSGRTKPTAKIAYFGSANLETARLGGTDKIGRFDCLSIERVETEDAGKTMETGGKGKDEEGHKKRERQRNACRRRQEDVKTRNGVCGYLHLTGIVLVNDADGFDKFAQGFIFEMVHPETLGSANIHSPLRARPPVACCDAKHNDQ